jgi:hypothetical protein
MDQIIGTYKEYVIIESNVLDELTERANELSKDSKGIYTQGIVKGITDSISLIKEKNIYTQDFQIKR